MAYEKIGVEMSQSGIWLGMGAITAIANSGQGGAQKLKTGSDRPSFMCYLRKVCPRVLVELRRQFSLFMSLILRKCEVINTIGDWLAQENIISENYLTACYW
jgi:hypothetical protein